MQWVIAFIAAGIAVANNSNPLVWGIIGFLLIYVFKLTDRITQLEQQLSELKQQFKLLKPTAVISPQVTTLQEPEPDISTTPPVFTPANPEPEPAIIIEAEQISPPLFEIPASNQKQTEDIKLSKPDTPTWTTPSYQIVESSDIEKLVKIIWGWFTDGNTFVRVGIVILFFGVSFLLNLAIDRGYIPIELRLSAIVAAALALLSVGWRLRETHSGYAVLVQGGAVGILYLTIFAAFNLYHLLPTALTFLLLVSIVGLAATLAILENMVSLALFGTIGGFLAPILTSTGTNNYIGLFSFYAVLNAGIFAIAWFKAWRILNLVGFTFTFSIGAFWGVTSYRPENFATVEPFLILFFLLYVGIAISYATRRIPNFKDYIDGTLIFGTPILAFGLQAAMVKNYEYGVAISAVVLGGFYLVLARLVWQRLGEQLKFLSETLLSICVIFLTLAIPFAVDGTMTSATWAVESTGVLWVSIRQQQVVRRIFALGLQAAAGIALLSDATSSHGVAFFNSAFLGVVIINISAGLSSWLLSVDFPSRRSFEKILSPLLLQYSLLWLLLGFEYQITVHQLDRLHNNLLLSLTAALTVFFTWLANRLSWTAARYATLAMMLPLLLVVMVTLALSSHPSAHTGLVFWTLAFISYFWALKKANADLALYLFSGLLLSALLFWEGFWQLLLAATLLSLLFNYLANRYQWQAMRVLALGLLPVMLFLSFSCFVSAAQHPFLLPDTKMGLSWPFEAGYLLWPLAYAVLYWLLYQYEVAKLEIKTLPLFHGLSLLLLVILPIWEASWHLSKHVNFSNGWFVALLPITAIATLWLIMQKPFWPFSQHDDDYQRWAVKPLMMGLTLWSVCQLNSPANPEPLPWLPVINPAELMQAMVLATLIRCIFFTPEQDLSNIQKRQCYLIIAVFGFIALNVTLLRTVHHWADLSWSSRLWSRALTQTCLSIFWTISGLFLTVVATKKQVRKLWIIGAALLVIVVGKLFLLDLQVHGSVERIVSFITVGLLLMLIGYFAPLPPKQQEQEHE